VELAEVPGRMGAPAAVAHAPDGESRAGLLVVATGDKTAFQAAVGATVEPQGRAVEPLERVDVHGAGKGEVAELRAGGAANDLDVPHGFGEQHVPVVVALGMAVDGLVDRDAVDPERDVGRGVRAESPNRGVRSQAGTLALLVDLDAAGLAQEIPRVGGGHALDGRLVECRAEDGVLVARRRGGRRHFLELYRA